MNQTGAANAVLQLGESFGQMPDKLAAWCYMLPNFRLTQVFQPLQLATSALSGHFVLAEAGIADEQPDWRCESGPRLCTGDDANL